MVRDERQPLEFRLVGLTGGIASGKSTVTRMLRAHGLIVLDADLLAREVVEPGRPALAEIAETFGPEVIAPDGTLDRAALGRRVFGDDAARARLNAITHPRIAMETASRIQGLRESGEVVVVYDAPLIVENRLHHGMNLLIVVAVTPQTQLQRLMGRDGLSEEAAEARLAAQLPLSAKVAVADVVIDNDGSLEATQDQVTALLERLPSMLWPDVPDAAARLADVLGSRSTG